MSFEYRLVINFFFGALDQAASVSDTTLKSSSFQSLPIGYSAATPGTYTPLALINPATGAYEIVWVTGHSSGSDTITVVRGKELTSAQAWPAGTQVEQAPTIRDVLPAVTVGTTPSDLHTGARVTRTDLKDVAEKTKDGLQPSVGVAFAAQVGPNMNAVNPPDGSSIMVRCGQVNATTNASGDINFNYRSPFPNGTLAVAYSSTDYNAIGPHVTFASTATGAGVTVFHNNARKASAATSFLYTAIGW